MSWALRMRVDAEHHVKTYLGSVSRMLWVAGVKCNPDYTVLTFSLLIAKCRRLAGWLDGKGWERGNRLWSWEAKQPALVWPSPYSCPADWLEEQDQGRDRCQSNLHLFSPYADLVITFLWEFQILCGICRASQETREGIIAYGDPWY